jgi:hypothetical protein
MGAAERGKVTASELAETKAVARFAVRARAAMDGAGKLPESNLKKVSKSHFAKNRAGDPASGEACATMAGREEFYG